jgi:dienelactone hydrolase
MSPTLIPFNLTGSQQQPIRGYLHLPPQEERAAVVLLAHGFKGWSGYGFLPRMAEALAQAGLAVLRFSFSHCGITGDGSTFDRPDLFERDTFADQIADTLALITALRDGKLPAADRLDAAQLGMVGHSRGGVTAILTSGQTDALKAIVTLAAPQRTLHDPHVRDQIRAMGRLPVVSSRTGQQLYMGRSILDDIEAAGDRYDLHQLLARYRGAYLAIHCEGDDTVGVEAARNLATWHTAGPTELLILPGGGHTFDFRHGQSGTTELLEAVTARVAAFGLKYLT